MRVLISAGELSGSMHAAVLVKKWRLVDDKVRFYGMGGAAMAEAGVDLVVNSERELGIIGLGGIVTRCGSLFKAWRRMLAALSENPDWLVLVDYAGFNLPLAKRAKKMGIRVCYFIPPKVWAWRPGRIELLRSRVDVLAVILPFEVDYYARRGLSAYYVGNPSWQAMQPLVGQLSVRRQSWIQNRTGVRYIGLLPGSRVQEIKRLLPIMLEAVSNLQQRLGCGIRFCLLPAESIARELLSDILSSYPELEVELLANGDWSSLRRCQAVVVASGTATLEVALLGIPMVAVYCLQWWEYYLAKHFIKIPYVTLCNIVANTEVVKELLQYDCRADKIETELLRLLEDSAYVDGQQLGYQRIRSLLGDSVQTDLVALLAGCGV